MTANKICLFDLATVAPNKCFSPNCWKARAALNFKGLPYTTTWLEYPDIKPTLAPLGVEPHPPESGPTEYTCPTVKLANGTYVMDSAKIVHVLEETQPEPSLHLEGPHERVHKVVVSLLSSLIPALLYRVRDGLNPRSAEYYEKKFSPMFGMGLDELATSDLAINAWANAEPSIHDLSAILREYQDGPFVLGTVASYADLVLTSVVHCIWLLDTESLARLYSYDEAVKTHYEACLQWFKRASY